MPPGLLIGVHSTARRSAPGLAHHTDCGCQYTAAAYQARPATYASACSMRRVGACLDDAMVERFFATLKAEFVGARVWPTRAAVRTAICACIGLFSNR